MVFKDGDFVLVEYSAWRVADNSLFYTTDEKKAKEHNVFADGTKYGPQLIILGSNGIVKGLEKNIKEMELNQSKVIEVNPEEGFGARSADLVRVLPINDFRKREIEPYVGMRVDLDGATAVVKSVNSGRVLVDANHPLAGEKVRYDIKVVEKLEDDGKKVENLVDYYGLKSLSVKIDGEKGMISFGSDIKKDANYFVAKTAMAEAVLKYVRKINSLEIIEEYARSEQQSNKAAQPS